MPYSGETFVIPCNEGGWNANPNTDLVSPKQMVDVININLHKGGRGTRGGAEVVNGTVIASAPQVMGLYQFRLTDGSESIVTATADGKIQTDYNTELKTGLTASKYSNFEVINDTLYVCNGADVPQTWDGSAGTTSDLALIPTDWAGTNFPKIMIKHGKGNSERLWGLGCPTTPKTVYASKNGSADFSDAEVKLINIETGDGFGIVGGVEYGDRLFCFGKRQAYVINDTDTDLSNWGYEAAQWTGGAAHERLICKTPNDIVAVTEDLDVYSVVAAESYGDYKAASLTRPAFINKWIDDNVDKSQINKFHIIYDPELRAIKLFVVRTGQTAVDTCLVYFIDLGPERGWTKHRYSTATLASCSALVRVSVGSWKIYTGGTAGYVFQLESSTFNDNGVYYYNGYTIPFVPIENARTTKRFDRLWLVIIPQATETINAGVSIDGSQIVGAYFLVDENSNPVVNESGDLITADTAVELSVTASASLTLQNLSVRLGKIGQRIQVEVYNETINTSFFVSQMMIDFMPVGSKAY
uniref:Uncharacterized protein n=1 Tax=viral metagenome TaxID=1070528 RepID=A0A6H1ZDW2_9ZZZZ